MKNSFLPYLAIAILGLGALFVLFRPGPEPVVPSPQLIQSPATSNPQAIEPEERVFDLTIRQHKLASRPTTLKAVAGDTVVLRITADNADEFHLHGYDRKVDLTPGQTSTLGFVADKAGRFEFELERTHSELGALEVQPR